jgi:hypothetical protein
LPTIWAPGWRSASGCRCASDNAGTETFCNSCLHGDAAVIGTIGLNGGVWRYVAPDLEAVVKTAAVTVLFSLLLFLVNRLDMMRCASM